MRHIGMRDTPSAHLESVEDSESLAESDFDVDSDGDIIWEDSDGSLDEDKSNPGYNASNLNDFTYEDEGKIYADGHAIRLLRLQGGAGPIQAYLFNAFLHKTGNGIPYEALSYTWGSSEGTEPINLNGQRFMLTENLYSALRYLRYKNKDRILWIDSVCIDQSQIAERNHQVSHMASIYRDADRVLFWLGEPTYETDVLISSLIRLEAQISNIPNVTRFDAHDVQWKSLQNDFFYNDLSTQQRGLVSLLARPWFERSWILQEVCFARTGVVVCGRRVIAAPIFALAPQLLHLSLEVHCKEVLRMMPEATRLTTAFFSGRETRNIYSLLRMFYRSKASDPRDQVYALFSMAADAKADGFPSIDYGKTFEEVLDSIFSYLFPKSWNLCGRVHSYQSLSEFVKDFIHLREAEIEATDDNILLQLRLSDDTELSHLHPQSAFQIAIQTGRAQLLEKLLRFSNINLNEMHNSYDIEDYSGRYSLTPLCEAAARGFIDVVGLLVRDSRLHSINSADTKSGRTSLSWAAQNGHKALIGLLLRAGADIDSKDNIDRTPLSWAAQDGRDAVIKLLLEAGADIDSKDNMDRTPLSWAAQNGRDAVIKLLLEAGADIDSKDNVGWTPLSWAALDGHEAMARLLLKAGADIHFKDKHGRSLVLHALEHKHMTIVDLLLKAGANVY